MIITHPIVRLIADSITARGDRLSTFELTYWRPLLAEMNTHRVFSRNASSSRASGIGRMLEQTVKNTWCPMHWNAEQKGMQGGKEFDDATKAFIDSRIQELAQTVVDALRSLDNEVLERTGAHIHKQYLNRYTEPFRPVRQLVSATDWDNFFNLRISPLAQPEIQDVAREMKELLDESEPECLTDDEWHLPYLYMDEKGLYPMEINKQISVARCARVCSGLRRATTLEQDQALYEMLRTNRHLSPFEHIACPDPELKHKDQWGNFHGWRQLRSFI